MARNRDAERNTESLRYRVTRYEAVLERGDERFLLTYCYPQSQRKLRDAAWDNIERVLDRTGLTKDTQNTVTGKGKVLAFHFPNGWTIRYSGRTQRDAMVRGEELPAV